MDTRYQRLDQDLKALLSFQSDYRDGFELKDECPVSVHHSQKATLDTNTKALFQPRPSPAAFRGAPNPAFLVAAVIEALSKSRYKNVTMLVPGEADPYCARQARSEDGIVLTCDSDLLIYDVGWAGSVVYLDQLELQVLSYGQRNIGSCTFIRAPVFEPHNIAHSLGLPDLVGLAYRMAKHPSKSVQNIISTFQIPLPTDPPLKASSVPTSFEDLYRVIPSTNEQIRFETEPLELFKKNGKFLDPRVSELILQFASPYTTDIPMFLPPLMEDPSRISAWQSSAEQRSFAYACLKFWGPPKECGIKYVKEYSRKGQRYVYQRSDVDARFSTPSGLSTYAQSFCHLFEKVTRHFQMSEQNIYWKLVGLTQVLNWYHTEQKAHPTENTAWNAVTAVGDGKWSWEDIHLSAQIQAALYSLRVIKQIMEYSYSKNDPPCFSPPLRALYEVLQDLPPLRLLLPTRTELQDLASNPELAELRVKLRAYLKEFLNDASAGATHVQGHPLTEVRPISVSVPQCTGVVSSKREQPERRQQGNGPAGTRKHTSTAAPQTQSRVSEALSDLHIKREESYPFSLW